MVLKKKNLKKKIAKSVLSMAKGKNLEIQIEPSTQRNPQTQTHYNLTAETKEKKKSSKQLEKNDVFSTEKQPE